MFYIVTVAIWILGYIDGLPSDEGIKNIFQIIYIKIIQDHLYVGKWWKMMDKPWYFSMALWGFQAKFAACLRLCLHLHLAGGNPRGLKLVKAHHLPSGISPVCYGKWPSSIRFTMIYLLKVVMFNNLFVDRRLFTWMTCPKKCQPALPNPQPPPCWRMEPWDVPGDRNGMFTLWSFVTVCYMKMAI